MIFLLIDTCSWINLIDSENENQQITELKNWINEGFIRLIVPQLIIDEWNNHKIKEKEKINQSLKTKEKHFQEIAKKSGNLQYLNYKLETAFIDNQINSIDIMLNTSPIKILPSDEIKVLVTNKQITPKKAPFHNKADSIKDALIYYSAMEYCQNNSITELIFISSNTSDFGKPYQQKKGSNSEIHPDLLTDFANIQVHYYGEIGKAIYELSNKLPPIQCSDIANLNSFENNPFNIDNNHILNQLDVFLFKIFKEISFIPLNILSNYFPFRSSKDSNTYYSAFTFTTDNQELTKLFEAIEVINNKKIKILNKKYFLGVEQKTTKIKKVVNFLNQNLIFKIYNYKIRKEISISFFEPKKNEKSLMSDFNKLKFVDIFKTLNSNTNNINLLQEKAYLHYRIGNYVKSSIISKKILNLAIEKKLFTKAFITEYNLSKLYIFIRNNYWKDNSQELLMAELASINLIQSSNKFSNIENQEIIKYIKEKTFYLESKDKIQSMVTQLLDQYYNQLSGGFSQNQFVYILINNFAELEAFVNENFIVFDQFKDFIDLSNNFFEGLFASHAIEDSFNSHLEYFDDWIIRQLIIYGNAEFIYKIFKRYKLTTIKYKESNSKGETFIDLIENFFSNDIKLRIEFVKIREDGNSNFWQYYSEIFCNILIIVSICNFTNDFINRFTLKLINYLENEQYYMTNSAKYVEIFFRRAGEKISTELIKRFFNIIINHKNYHFDLIFDTVNALLLKRKEKLSITAKQFLIIKNLAFEKCLKCKEHHLNTIIIPIYKAIKNNNYRNEISNFIHTHLSNNFDFQLYYESSIFNIISFDKSLFEQAINFSLPNNNQKSTNLKNFMNIENRYDSVNQIINLSFKYKINTNSPDFQRFKDLDNYYYWLLDMENFNYNNFIPSWILEYPTSYYNQKIGLNMKVKKYIESYLIRNNNLEIERTYINIYVRKNWNKIK